MPRPPSPVPVSRPTRRMVGAGSGTLVVGGLRHARRPGGRPSRKPHGGRHRHGPLGPHARRHACSARATRCCGPPSCGTTAAPRPNAPRSRPPVPRSTRASPATSSCRASRRRSSPGCARHEPAIFGRVIRKVLLPKDYVRLRLTGDYASDMSDAAGTCWLDVGGRRWSDALLAATGLDRSQMPELFEGTEADRAAAGGRCAHGSAWTARTGGGGRRRRQCGLGLRASAP